MDLNTGLILLTRWCNIFGDSEAGAKRVLGGLGSQKPSVQWYCKNPSAGRYRMECEHGHRGQIMEPCVVHLRQFRDAVTFCPRCNTDPPGHKCKLLIHEVS
jgi:hypothetical protein